MTSTVSQTIASLKEEFDASAQDKNYQPLWTVFGQMVPPRPNPRAVPAIWRYDQIKPDLMKAGAFITAEEAERRVLMLVNPGMDAPHTTDAIYGGLQLVLPGETAPAHRHVAFALRLIIEGNGGFTAIEGQKIRMEPGDVVLTPSWCWHDHGNDGQDPIIWLDGLDLPLFQRLPVNFAEQYAENRYPALDTEDSPIRFPWRDVQAMLDGANLPYAIHHYHRRGKSYLSDTISAQAERLSPGYTTAFHQETCSFLYHVIHGQGMSKLITANGKESEIHWKAKDTFAVPAWCRIQHTSSPEEPAYLFAINDRPMLESLGLIRQA
ncbi:hypothetical protein ABOM_011036 [Aspergillus bombycis]|uniref:Cupin type-2 domain-containing protein n=1 Tax=Aspergillus bombycis TaxID=109264 RepID=A0A1F7ZMR5_9EURO|nr:hypothetical protein ABOM_011036 [Aspergillus bombycis]OGM40722.1 hypothetical protein ABOM_011036 [Aspergillus bombycis]